MRDRHCNANKGNLNLSIVTMVDMDGSGVMMIDKSLSTFRKVEENEVTD